MSAPYKHFRTLAKGGKTETFETYTQARLRAEQIADETGQWCGIEERGGRGWGLIGRIDPRQS